MSSDAAKKRKVNDNISSDTVAAAGVEDIIAEMKVHMTRMQNETETRIISMQNEMDSIKSRLSQMDELKKENKMLETGAVSMRNEVNLLKRENTLLKAKCESLERSMKTLVDERKWEYSAPNIPESHWDERGFDGEYIEWMGYLLGKIKETTCELRSGRDMHNEWINVGNDDSDIVLLYDDLLLPHWKELANAMQLYRKGKLKLSIVNLQLSTSVIDLLKPVLKHTPIDYFELQNNSFVNVSDGIEFAVEVMKSNETIQGLFWTSNTINSMEDARYLVDSIISHPSIDKIGLENCFVDDTNGYDILSSLLTSNKNFAEIDLERNHIRTGGDTAISDYLASNPPLKKLFLANNNLNDEDAVLIARALKNNTNLQFISVYRNNITDVGHNALCKAIYDPGSLNSLSDCNHTCIMYGVDLGNIPENFAGLRNRARKIYHLLSLRNKEGSNVYHLNLEFGDEDEGDGTLKLVPRVLESVHHYASERSVVPSLSIMYEILRGWKIPELYEAR